MSALKLTIGAATNPYKWVRAITFSSSPPPLSLRHTIPPCAPAAHVSIAPFGFSGFRLSRFRDLRCFSSAGKGGFPGSGIVDDMAPLSGPEQNGWPQNGLRRSNQPTVPPSSKMTESKENQQTKFLTLPTILTLGRVAAVPLLICTFYMDSWWATTATTGIFIAAAITDWLDGYLARKMKLGSAFGAFLDPVADKLMVAATLVLLCTKPMQIATFGDVPWLLPVPAIAIIGREITMSAVREWAASQNSKLLEAVAVNNLGKWKTATQMIALTILLAMRDSSLGGPGSLVASGVGLLYISAGLSLWSLAVYMGKISKVLLK